MTTEKQHIYHACHPRFALLACLKKAGEESSEVIIAAFFQSKEELTGEINNQLFHVLVLMVGKGITPEDIEKEMQKRRLKQHNQKEERKPIVNL